MGVIVALLLLLVVLGPRLLTRGAATSAKAADAPSGQTVAAPVLVGKTLDEAGNAAGAAGVNVAVGDPVHDDVVPPDHVSGQVPAPSAPVQAGGLITVSLSLGPEEPTPVPAQAQPSQEQPAQQAPASSAPPAAQQSKPAPAPKVPPGQAKKDAGKKGKDH